MIPDASESELLQLAALGDRSALSRLLLRYYDDLARHVTRQLAGEAPVPVWPVEDVIQETFYRAAQAVKSFEDRGPGSFRGWLKTIATNLIKDARKRRHRERRAISGEPSGGRCSTGSSQTGLIERLADSSSSPSCRVRRGDSIRRMKAALDHLPPEHRDIIERYYFRDETWDEIARATNRSKESVRGICFRARQALRVILGNSSQYLSG